MIMPLPLLAIALALACPALAQDQEPNQPAEPAFADQVTQVPIPGLELPPATPPTLDETARIRALITRLAAIDQPDFGLSQTLTGQAFAPIPSQGQFGAGIITNHNLSASPAFTELVKLGPRAMPLLLESLTDARPTKLKMTHERGFGGMWFDTEVDHNPLNPRERDAIKGIPRADPDAHQQDLTEYQVTIGDACFVILGQITGRAYSAVRYQPTACIVINSPTNNPAIAQALRKAWGSPDSARTLLDSLLIDFCTRGKYAGEFSLDNWYVGATAQIPAATRLLYYFPDQTAALIAARLDGLDVRLVPYVATQDPPEHFKQVAANGVDCAELIDALAWSDRPEVRAALTRIMARTDDPYLFTKCVALPDETPSPAAAKRLLEFIDRLPPDDEAPFGETYDLLMALTKCGEQIARPVFERVARDASMHHHRAACAALRNTNSTWGIGVLAILLDDTQKADHWKYPVNPESDQPRLPIRVCDEAAAALHALDQVLAFEMKGQHADLDAQIALIKQQLAARAGNR